jgi:hypothetical protein
MTFMLRACVGLMCMATATSVATAQTLVIAPEAYTIVRGTTQDSVRILSPTPITLTGGDTITVTLRLPQPLGIDLGQTKSFDTLFQVWNPAACDGSDGECRNNVPFFDFPASVRYYTAAGELVPSFSGNVYVFAGAGTLDETTQVALTQVFRDDNAPFNSEFTTLSEVRISFNVPSYFQTTTAGVQTSAYFDAYRGVPSDEAPPLLVQGKDLGILQIVSAAIAALQQAGVDAVTAAALGIELRAALESIAAGDPATGTKELNSFFDHLNDLVDSGVLSTQAARSLRPNILREVAALRSR